MRDEEQPFTPTNCAADFKINFQMTDAGSRRACSVTIRAPSKADASAIFRNQWLTIQKLAREGVLTKECIEIRLEELAQP